MNRRELEHVIRAAADLADDDEIIVIGSQAILGQYPEAPAELRVSMEADVYPKNRPERWDLIDGTIGEGSPRVSARLEAERNVSPLSTADGHDGAAILGLLDVTESSVQHQRCQQRRLSGSTTERR
jgi:hypothetical protein